MPEEKLQESHEDKPEKTQKKSRSFLNKVVIRKLPPSLNAETFIEMISPLPDYSDLYFCPADWTLGAEATSRAYIEFKKEEDIFIFKDKFDGYVFVDGVRGSDYPAIVEYAAFQGLPKSRARKKDKNVGTIEECDHFLSFLEQLKKEEDEEPTAKNEVTYSYRLKDDKKITSTPLIEFLAAKNQEKRDAKRRKVDDKRKQRDDEKHKKKIQVAKNIPESIKESKEEVVYADGISVRTVPSRLGRNDRKKEKEVKSEPKPEKEPSERDHERRDKRDKERYEKKEPSERDTRRKKERDEKRKAEREQRNQQKAKDREQPKETEATLVEGEKLKETAKESTNKEAPAKNETKRYSALRKARQEKSSDVKESTEPKQEEEDATLKDESQKASTEVPKVAEKPARREEDPAKKEARLRRAQEQRERRAREADERAQRHIKNKDRPTLQFYQPKRRQDNDGKGESLKSSDEYSEASQRKRSDNDHKSEKRERRNDKKSSRKNSRDESGRKKTSRKNSDESVVGDKTPEVKNDATVEKLEKLKLDSPKKSPETSNSEKAMKAEIIIEASKVEVKGSSGDVQE